jgi:hypothetical protein
MNIYTISPKIAIPKADTTYNVGEYNVYFLILAICSLDNFISDILIKSFIFFCVKFYKYIILNL